MSTPSNPSGIMIYKIVRDFENTGKTTHLMSELDYFSQQVIDFANSISGDDFWIVQTPEIKDDLSKICDISSSVCEFNEQKYANGGKIFAKTKIGQMPYPWLKGAIKTLTEHEETSCVQTSMSSIHDLDGKE